MRNALSVIHLRAIDSTFTSYDEWIHGWKYRLVLAPMESVQSAVYLPQHQMNMRLTSRAMSYSDSSSTFSFDSVRLAWSGPQDRSALGSLRCTLFAGAGPPVVCPAGPGRPPTHSARVCKRPTLAAYLLMPKRVLCIDRGCSNFPCDSPKLNAFFIDPFIDPQFSLRSVR